jgi:molybdopterin-guanine dinucleotide biosynthesis protein A
VTSAAIVLAGGGSTRMGTPKADLEWHGSTLLLRAVGIVARAVDGPVVVVRAAGQRLAILPPGIEITEDAHPGRGPLEGIAAGLRQVGDRAQAVYVTGVDAPFLHPAFVRRVVALLGPDDDVALPRAHGFAQPLAAAYRTATVAPALREVLDASEQLGTRALLRCCRVAEIGAAQLLADPAVAAFDPALDSLVNINEQREYDAARARPAPAVTIDVDNGEPPVAIRAATLAAALAPAGFAVGGDIRATINGRPADDPLQPLVTGDEVVLIRDS